MTTALSFKFLQVRIDVRQDRRRGNGWLVQVMFCPGMDELWETITHFALFEDKADAEALAARIKAAGRGVDLAYWTWSPSKCTSFGQLQEQPTAVLETTPRPRVRF